MKKQAFNPFLPSWEYIPDGEPHVLGNVFICLALMTDLTARSSA